MILLVPTSPEVPPVHRPKTWPGLVLVVLLCIGYLEARQTVEADSKYVDSLYSLTPKDLAPRRKLSKKSPPKDVSTYLKLRPMLKIAPSRGDWNVKRLVLANFVHGSPAHLVLNLIGAFAGARICTTFMPFLCTLSIFLFAGSLGLWVSLNSTFNSNDFIPHLGASAGIFGLMGAYYVYNFRFRTRYFFWFPSRHGQISLKTSWFFFLDVLLLEIIFSAAQFFPGRLDAVDHIAHVVGFGAGVALALGLRFFQHWPHFLQTRAEFLYWNKLIIPRWEKQPTSPYDAWLELLSLNPYNDLLKVKLCRMMYTGNSHLTDEQIQRTVRCFSPTFIRLQTEAVAISLKECIVRQRPIPSEWYTNTPYDSVIRIAKVMADPPEEQIHLFRFIQEYQKFHPDGSDTKKKLELLMKKLSGIMADMQAPASPSATPGVPPEAGPTRLSTMNGQTHSLPLKPMNEQSRVLVDTPDSAPADTNQQDKTVNLDLEMATPEAKRNRQ